MNRRKPRAQGLDMVFCAETYHACGMDRDAGRCEMLEGLELEPECGGLGTREAGELLLAGSLDAYAHVDMGKPGKIPCVGFVVPDEDAVRFQDEGVLFRDQFEDFEQMLAAEGGLVPTDPELREMLSLRNANESLRNIAGAVEGTDCFWPGGHVP